MRNWIIGIVLTISGLITNAAHGMYHEPQGWFDVSTGWRKDSLHWTVGNSDDDSSIPNIRSTLRWRDVYIAQILAQAKYVNCYNFYFRGYADYGSIYHGRQKDADFVQIPETGNFFEFSRSHAKANRGNVYDFSGGIGYMFRFLCGRATITPILGYSYHRQHFRMRDLVVTIDDIDGLVGPVGGLHSKFTSEFKGWWGGADTTLYMTSNWWLLVSGEFHWGMYKGRGHWNLRTEFLRDFRQHSDAVGQVWTVGTNWEFCRHWYLTFFGRYQMWVQTNSGIDHVFLATGPVKSRLRAVRFHSMTYQAGIGYYF